MYIYEIADIILLPVLQDLLEQSSTLRQPMRVFKYSTQ